MCMAIPADKLLVTECKQSNAWEPVAVSRLATCVWIDFGSGWHSSLTECCHMRRAVVMAQNFI